MIILDTNVVSEMMREAPNREVLDWVRRQPSASLFISAITEAELRLGIALLPEGRRRAGLYSALEAAMTQGFQERVLPFDSPAAIAYAEVAAKRRTAGRPIAEADAQIAAIALSRGGTIATRNIRDFEDCGVDLVNPWQVGR